MDKAEIEKILDDSAAKLIQVLRTEDNVEVAIKKSKEFEQQATSSLTSLIIKWLEDKRVNPRDFVMECDKVDLYVNGRNQLITELVEELK